MTDLKKFRSKMDRREFLKKAGIGGAGLWLGLLVHLLFSLIRIVQVKAYDGDEDIENYGKHQAGITTPSAKRLATWWC